MLFRVYIMVTRLSDPACVSCSIVSGVECPWPATALALPAFNRATGCVVAQRAPAACKRQIASADGPPATLAPPHITELCWFLVD